MGKRRLIDLQWPAGGLDASAPYAKQQPYFAPRAQNVRPEGTLENRLRGGSRPGLGKAFYSELGSGAKVRMLEPLTYVSTSKWKLYQDDFDGTSLGGDWTAASWCDAAPGIAPDDFGNVATTNTHVGAVLDDMSQNSSSQYEIGIFVVPQAGEHYGSYEIYGRMNTTTPVVTTDGFLATLTMTDGAGTFSGNLKTYKAGVLQNTRTFTATASPLGYAPSGWFKVLVNGNNVTVTFLENTLLTSTDISADLGASANHRVGFGMNCTDAGGIMLTETFRLLYYTSAQEEASRELLCASANGTLYVEGFAALAAVSSNLTLATNHRIEAKDFLQKLYIADWGGPIIDTTVTVSGADAAITGVTTSLVNKYDFVVRLYTCTGPTAGVYAIDTVGTNTIKLTSSPGDGTCSARVERALKVYDPAAATLTVLAATSAKGEVPLGAKHLAIYRSRLCLAKDHVCYQSRVDDPQDWLYSDEDVEGAVATTATDSERGQIGDIITALIPVGDDYMVYGCQNSIYVQVGDVQLGGEIANVTREHGILENAWCLGPAGEVFYLSHLGLYMLPAGSGRAAPVAISKDRLPKELAGVNTEIYEVCMRWDTIDEGLHIYLTSKTESSARYHWWLDWGTKSFWPVAVPADFEPYSITTYRGWLVPQSSVILGCRDGYLRYYADGFETDETTDITSYLDFGPFYCGTQYNDGRVDELVGVMARDSGPVTWSVRVGEESQGAVINETNHATGTFSAGLNYRVHPRARGGAAVVRLTGTGGRRWAFERMGALLTVLGLQRK